MQKSNIEIARSGVIDQEIIPPEVIIDCAKQYNETYFPLTNEHDIRKPPIGRISSAKVIVLEDGTHILKGEAEIFEESDTFDSLEKSDKHIKIDAREIEIFEVFGNQTFEEDQEIANLYRELQELGKVDPNCIYREDSIEPLSLLIISFGLFSLKGIANGFFSKFGEDLYETLKLKLKQIFEKKSLKQKENLLQFQFFVNNLTGKPIEINVVIINPSQDDLDGFFDFIPTMLDRMILDLPIDDLDVCRIVFSYEFTELKLLYMLRSDGVPITLRLSKS